MPVPVWVIILAVLAGLLLLAVLVFVMHRVRSGRRKGVGGQEEWGRTEGEEEEEEEGRREGRRIGVLDDDGARCAPQVM